MFHWFQIEIQTRNRIPKATQRILTIRLATQILQKSLWMEIYKKFQSQICNKVCRNYPQNTEISIILTDFQNRKQQRGIQFSIHTCWWPAEQCQSISA